MHVPVEKLCPGISLLPISFGPGGGDGEVPGGLGDVPGLGEGLASGGGGLVLVLGPCFGKTLWCMAAAQRIGGSVCR